LKYRSGESDQGAARRVDLRRRRIEVVEAITEVHGRVIIGITKTHQRRSVPIPCFLSDELTDQLAEKAPSDLVFTAPQGGVLRKYQLPATVLRPSRDEGRAAWAGPRTSCGTPRPASA
jgi:hypothetical protein